MRWLISILALLALPVFAEQKVPARQVSVVTSSWEYIEAVPETAQGALDYLDDQVSNLNVVSGRVDVLEGATNSFVRTNDTRALNLSNWESVILADTMFASNITFYSLLYGSNATFTGGITLGGVHNTSWPVAGGAPYLTADTNLFVSNSMTTAAIQAAIDTIPKNLNGFLATVWFNAGTYALTDTLSLDHFYGGWIDVRGVDANGGSGIYSNQTSILDGDGLTDLTDTAPLYFYNSSAVTTVSDFKILVDGTQSEGYNYGINLGSCKLVLVRDCYFVGNSATEGYGVHANSATDVTLASCLFNTLGGAGTVVNGARMFEIIPSPVGFSYTNTWVGTQPEYYFHTRGGMVHRCYTNAIGSAAILNVSEGGLAVTNGGYTLP